MISNTWPVRRSGSGLGLAMALLVGAGCGSDADPDVVTCGDGTELQDGMCVATPVDDTSCGEGTVEEGGTCVPTDLEPGRFRNPLVLLQELQGVGSHTDEVRIREDGLLLNCSYTFNVIDATSADDMEIVASGLRHTIGDFPRQPGCKHLAWDGDLVFTTHLGNIRNPAFLSGWDISDPENPVQLGYLQEDGISYEGVDVANGNIFVGLHEDGLGVYRYDTGASAFARIGSLGGFTNAWGVAARGDHVFVADGIGGFATVDASDPANPVELGRVAVGGTARAVVVEGDHAYVAAGSAGVAVVDISDLASPTVTAQIDMPGTALRLDHAEDHIFVAAWNDVRVYDVSDPAAPIFAAAVRVPRDFDYEDVDRERPTHRIFGVAARGRDVFIGAWEHPYAYRFFPERQAPNLRLPETAARVDVGRVAAGESKTVPLEVENQGTAPLTITDTWVDGDGFAVSPRQARIAPGDRLLLEITYTAASDDEAVGYLGIASDDPAYPVRRPYVVANPPGVAVGAPLPATTATLLDGTDWSSDDAAGSVLLISYFATYCPNCTLHIPDLQERFVDVYGPQGLVAVALNPREGLEEIGKVQGWADAVSVDYPLGIESPATTYQAVVENFTGPNPFPVDVIVGKDGTVRYAAHEYDPDAMQAVIEAALAE